MGYVIIRRLDDLRILLILGYGVLAIGTLFAYLNPATGYEASIYDGTPALFWVSVVIALVIAVSRTFALRPGRQRKLSVLLSGLTMTTIVALPIIRGYHYVGDQDPLTHLGIARDINEGAISMIASRYPAVHILGSITSDIGGIELTHSLLIFVVVFVLSFFVFIPLAVRELTADPTVVLIGVFSGFLLLQLNFLGVHMQVHPTSQAVMYVAPMLYLFIENYRRSDIRFFVFFIVTFGMFVVLHPQQGANFLIFYGTIAGVHVIHSVFGKRIGLQTRKSTILSAMAFFAICWIWASNLPAFEHSISRVIVALMIETDTGTEIASRGVSLSELGGSYEEIFFRMFSIALIYCISTGLLMSAVATHFFRLNPIERLRFMITNMDKEIQVLLLYFIAGFVAITSLFFFYLIGDITSQYFRHYGFIMVFVTVMGAIAIGRTFVQIKNRLERDRAQLLRTAIVLLFLFLTIPVIHPSPFIYQTSGHVTEAQVEGFEGSFEYWGEGMTYGQIRPSLDRYDRAIHGERSISPRIGYRNEVPDHFAEHELRAHWAMESYLPVTRADRVRDGQVYQGFRFSEEDFRYLDSEPGINKVRANGEFELYLVHPEDQS